MSASIMVSKSARLSCRVDQTMRLGLPPTGRAIDTSVPVVAVMWAATSFREGQRVGELAWRDGGGSVERDHGYSSWSPGRSRTRSLLVAPWSRSSYCDEERCGLHSRDLLTPRIVPVPRWSQPMQNGTYARRVGNGRSRERRRAAHRPCLPRSVVAEDPRAIVDPARGAARGSERWREVWVRGLFVWSLALP